MSFRPILWFNFAATVLAFTARAELTLAPVFQDHAILQREKPLPIWGRAKAGEKITVTFHEQTVSATADETGRWIVYFEPLPASADAAELVVKGEETIVVKDVLIGDVWIASGQSNTEWQVGSLHDDEKQIAAIDLPFLRQLRIAHVVAGEPAETVATTGWQLASPSTVGGFSAVGYFFGRELQRKLGVPVGIIHSSWGGTDIASWMSETARRSTSVSAAIDARWEQAMSEWTPERIARYPANLEAWQAVENASKTAGTKNLQPRPRTPATLDSPGRPGGLFNGMIAPLQPAAIRGFIWYQGESNVSRPAEYAELFPAMIRAWRANWGDDALPFYFVQLPNYAAGNPRGREWARLREAQMRALELPATAMAVTIDIGDPDDLHPTRKMEIGRRLALAAKAQAYGIPGDYSGPLFDHATREGTAMRIRFHHAASGLVAHNRPVQVLEIAGPDHVFHVGTGRIDRDTLVVSSPDVSEPVAVRYAWSNAPEANLYNGAGLPAAPFRSDDW
jgi:sialate O-acetylesterase